MPALSQGAEQNMVAACAGLGSAVAEFYAEEKVRPLQKIIALDKDKYPDSGEYDTLLYRCGLTREQMTEEILKTYTDKCI